MTSQPTTTPRLPGRLGNPGMALRDDPRADPRMLAAMAPLGLADPQPPPPVDADSSLEELHAFCDEAEVGYEARAWPTSASSWTPVSAPPAAPSTARATPRT